MILPASTASPTPQRRRRMPSLGVSSLDSRRGAQAERRVFGASHPLDAAFLTGFVMSAFAMDHWIVTGLCIWALACVLLIFALRPVWTRDEYDSY